MGDVQRAGSWRKRGQGELSQAQLPGLGQKLRERKEEELTEKLPFGGDYVREGSQATLFGGPSDKV